MKIRIPFIKSRPSVAVIRMSGTIGTMARAQLNDEAIGPVIEKAFQRGKPAAVALLLNSPGGSPVQSSLIGARIRRLAEEYDLPVHAFVEDVAASGGYWLATAADDIWVDPGSIVGSIGVISSGFGAPVLLARQGIERRVHTSVKSKSMLDPFKPEDPEDVARLQDLLSQIHDQFVTHVQARRGDRLTKEIDLFTGEFWLGRRAVELGLVDGEAHLLPKLKELYGEKVRLRWYGGRRRGLLSYFGASLAQDALASIEERATYARYGL